MLITLLRHAEVDEAYVSCYNGHIDIDLSDTGRQQAKALGEHFELNRFDAVYCSDLVRAKETIAHIPLNIPVNYTNQLREKSWGRHEGKTFDQIMMMEQQEYQSFEQWLNLLDGEEMEHFIKRVNHFFRVFLPAQGHDNILVVTHAGVIRSLMSLLRNIPLEEAYGIQFGYANYVTLDTEIWKCGPLVCPI
jgi:alpha-ribazole phosphatase/probable phosphoglycerate mutase